MSKKVVQLTVKYLIFFTIFMAAFPVMAQDTHNGEDGQSDIDTKPPPKESVFFFAPFGELSLNSSKSSPSFGGGFTIGVDGRVGGGISGTFLYNVLETENEPRVDALEITAFLRVYVKTPTYGPFFQLNYGPVIYFEESNWTLPASAASFSGGLSFGWRFPIWKWLYIEPVVRGGYPFMISGNLAVGFRY